MMGFLSSEQGSGNYISCDISRNLADSLNLLFLLGQIDYRQVSETRKALETEAALLAADRITPVQLAQLERLVSSISNPDESRNSEPDRDLHELIAKASQNELINQLLTALMDSIDTFVSDMRREIKLNPENGRRLQAAHEQLVDGLRRSDKNEIIRALDEHFYLIDTNIKGPRGQYDETHDTDSYGIWPKIPTPVEEDTDTPEEKSGNSSDISVKIS